MLVVNEGTELPFGQSKPGFIFVELFIVAIAIESGSLQVRVLLLKVYHFLILWLDDNYLDQVDVSFAGPFRLNR